MPEEIGQVAVAPEGAVTPPETPTMFNAEGGFTENWTQSLTDTALHDNETLKTAKTVEALAAMTVSAQKMVGSDKIAIPNEASSEIEWDAFHKAGGRPETVDDYNWTRPEDLPEEHYFDEYAKGVQAILFKYGGSKKMADELFEFGNKFTVGQLATKSQDDKLALQTLEDGLYADWGNAFEQKKHLGNMAMNEAASEMKGDIKVVNQEFKQRLVEKAGSDPDIIRAFANLGSKFSEAGSPEISLIPTTGDIQNEITEAMAHKAHGPDFKQHGFTKAQHEAQVDKVSQLFLKKHPKGK